MSIRIQQPVLVESPTEDPIVFEENGSFRRSRSRRKRKMQEQEVKRRIRGDSHWSKVLQVNSEKGVHKHTKCIRICRGFGLGGTQGCGIGLSRGFMGGNRCLSNFTSKIRLWLQSKRRYEVSPVEGNSERKGGACESDRLLSGERSNSEDNCLSSSKNETGRGEENAVIRHLNHLHPELRRSNASLGDLASQHHLSVSKSAQCIQPHIRKYSKSKLAAVPPAQTLESDVHFSSIDNPVHRTSSKQQTSVNINIEFAEPHQALERSLPLPVNKLSPVESKNRIITPATRALSRSQQLRQSRNKYLKLLQQAGQLSPGRSPLTGTISAPAKHGVGKKGSPSIKRRPIKTWPLPCRKLLGHDNTSSCLVAGCLTADQYKNECDLCVGDSETELPFIQEMCYDKFNLRAKSSLKDFSIRFEELGLGELCKKGRRVKLYKGRWHGDVIVHVFGELRHKDKDAFWANLGKLCRIRHENIILFMAACTTPPNLAVVTCNPQAKSLYDHIHHQREKTTIHTKIQVLRQIAQGMGYLHAKGIVLRKLNSKNVFIGNRVKVSAMDCGFLDVTHDRPNYGSIPRGHLAYIAPELMCGIRVIPPRLTPTSPYSPETDVFAFGTVMYEVITGRFPYHNAAPEVIIWQICTGHRQILYSINCSVAIKTLIEDCWAHEPLYRPEFKELCRDLQRHSPLHKKHSSSMPRLNRGLDYES